MNYTTKFIMVAAAALIIGTASAAFAQDAAGDGIAPGRMYSCLNQRGMGKFRGGMGMFPVAKALSDEQIEKLEVLKTEFRNATLDLRQELGSKRLALQSELAKKEPDANTARALQKDISSLSAEIDQKRIEHVLEVKKIAPYGYAGQLRDSRESLRGGRFRRM